MSDASPPTQPPTPHELGSILFALVLAISAAAGSGCGKAPTDRRPRPVPVSGTVVFDGAPSAGAVVMFAPQDHQYAASARTAEDGTFRLQTFAPDDGAVPGKYRVVVYKVDVIDLPNGGVREDQHLPRLYHDKESTPLAAVVSADGKNDITLTLTNQPSEKLR